VKSVILIETTFRCPIFSASIRKKSTGKAALQTKSQSTSKSSPAKRPWAQSRATGAPAQSERRRRRAGERSDAYRNALNNCKPETQRSRKRIKSSEIGQNYFVAAGFFSTWSEERVASRVPQSSHPPCAAGKTVRELVGEDQRRRCRARWAGGLRDALIWREKSHL